MVIYILKRVGSSLLMLFIISIVIFVAIRLLPGDPTTVALAQSPGVSPEAIAKVRLELGLDQHVLVQYWQWISGVVVGDFGVSYFSKYPVAFLISQRLPATVMLAVSALVVGSVLAVLAALTPVRLRSAWLERLVNFFTAIGLAAPVFVVGILLVLFFANVLNILPASGYVPFSENPSAALRSLVLPSLTLSLALAPQLVRYLQGSIARWVKPLSFAPHGAKVLDGVPPSLITWYPMHSCRHSPLLASPSDTCWEAQLSLRQCSHGQESVNLSLTR